jgi:hypothetical protein
MPKYGVSHFVNDDSVNFNVDGHPSRGQPRRRWMHCVKDDMKIKGVSKEMTSDRREWKKKICCADPT